MQYHLTRPVYAAITRVVGAQQLTRHRKLRRFLQKFADEEELHYLIAKSDIDTVGGELSAEPIDVTLWHSYFDTVSEIRPFIRLGATSILENASGGPVRPALRRALDAPFLSENNTRFIVIHQHETTPHGEQILSALDSEDLSQEECEDLIRGAKISTVLFCRMADWALSGTSLSDIVIG